MDETSTYVTEMSHHELLIIIITSIVVQRRRADLHGVLLRIHLNKRTTEYTKVPKVHKYIKLVYDYFFHATLC